MELNIGINGLKKNSVSIDDLLARLNTGNAILFTGAGFSIDTTNLLGGNPPLASVLAKKISKLAKLEPNENLMYVSDYHLKYKKKSELLTLLKNNFILNDVSQEHINICSLNWKKYYTTNYDNSIELSVRKNGNNIESLTLENSPIEHINNELICLHINGKIENSTENDLKNNIKLSNSSYISPDSFVNSNWFYHFKRDLEICSALVFIGYSLYDIDVQKFLFENPDLQDKTYFITSKSPKDEEIYFMSKFGHILPIGVSGFSKIISDNHDSLTNKHDDRNIESLVLNELSNEYLDIKDSEVERFILHGEIKHSHLDFGIFSEQIIPYLINRDQLDEALKLLKNNNNVIIVSELGNGKSILLKNLATLLTNNGIPSYILTDEEGDYLKDLDHLSKLDKNVTVIVDDYIKHFNIVEHYQKIKPSNINLLISSRSAEHERNKQNLVSLNFELSEINIDIISQNEIDFLISIIDNIGLWGEKASWNNDRKREYITKRNHSQISLILLDLFNAPYIVNKVSSVTRNLFVNESYKDTTFSIALIETIGIRAKSSLISELAMNDVIYSTSLVSNKYFRELFKYERNEVKSKSSVFSLSLINNYFSATYIVKQLLKVVRHLNPDGINTKEEQIIFKTLLRFSFVERLLPEKNKKNNLHKYYSELKVVVPWLKKNPHFWVQFGMSCLPYKDYKKAQDYFEQAYSFAKNKTDYHTENIDTQQSRLFLLQAIDENDPIESFILFDKANTLLNSLNNNVYKFRQVIKYRDYYSIKFKILRNKEKVLFEHACKEMLQSVHKAESDGNVDTYNDIVISKLLDNLNYIITNIKKNR